MTIKSIDALFLALVFAEWLSSESFKTVGQSLVKLIKSFELLCFALIVALRPVYVLFRYE